MLVCAHLCIYTLISVSWLARYRIYFLVTKDANSVCFAYVRMHSFHTWRRFFLCCHCHFGVVFFLLYPFCATDSTLKLMLSFKLSRWIHYYHCNFTQTHTVRCFSVHFHMTDFTYSFSLSLSFPLFFLTPSGGCVFHLISFYFLI